MLSRDYINYTGVAHAPRTGSFDPQVLFIRRRRAPKECSDAGIVEYLRKAVESSLGKGLSVSEQGRLKI